MIAIDVILQVVIYSAHKQSRDMRWTLFTVYPMQAQMFKETNTHQPIHTSASRL